MRLLCGAYYFFKSARVQRYPQDHQKLHAFLVLGYNGDGHCLNFTSQLAIQRNLDLLDICDFLYFKCVSVRNFLSYIGGTIYNVP